MPIGVPRIIYCWGEELPAQWTDIYNFIFRRRMVFLMQYLDDELCNQICGLLINIHMEDRSKELEKKEMERSGVFKSSNSLGQSAASLSSQGMGGQNASNSSSSLGKGQNTSFFNKKSRSMEDLLNADEDLGIDEIDTLEQYTLQKITTEWLNWNAQFFDYSDEPYLFYLAELLSKDFNKAQNNQKVNEKHFSIKSQPNGAHDQEPSVNLHSKLLRMLKNKKEVSNFEQNQNTSSLSQAKLSPTQKTEAVGKSINQQKNGSFLNHYDSLTSFTNKAKIQMGQVYSPFRTNVNFANNLVDMVAFKGKTEASANISSPSEQQQENKQQTINSQGYNKDLLFKQYTLFGENASFKENKHKLLEMFQQYKNGASKNTAMLPHAYSASKNQKDSLQNKLQQAGNLSLRSIPAPYGKGTVNKNLFQKTIYNLLSNLAHQNFTSKLRYTQNFAESTEKILGQRNLRREYNLEKNFSSLLSPFPQGDISSTASTSTSTIGLNQAYKQGTQKSTFAYGRKNLKSLNYLNSTMSANSLGGSSLQQSEFRDYYRKQTERALIEEESKKVFVIINSFGGSVGNGVTVHDALQFIKAGSLTLALGVAASAASLALAGGTIGERYVTEGCHVMIHQPESGLQGQASDIWIDSQEIMKIRLDVAEIYSLATYRPRHKILRDLDRDFYLSATETIQYGLADEIATNEIMQDIIEMTSKVWDYHDGKQQRLLEARESASSNFDTQTQN